MGDNRAAVYLEDDRVIYRASSIGNCIGSLLRHRLGITPEPPPEWLQAKFDEGNVAEPIMLRALAEKEGWRLLAYPEICEYGTVQEETGQVETEMKVGSKVTIRCHPDGVAQCFRHELGVDWELKDRRVVEVKAFGPDFAKKYKREGIMAFPFYSWQLAIEMLSTGLPAIYGVGEKQDDGTVEADGIDWTHVYDPPHTRGEIMARVMRVEKLAREVESGTLNLSEVPCDWAQYPCGFWTEHDETSVDSVWYKGVTHVEQDFDLALMDSLAMEYQTNKAIEKKAKEKASAASKGLAALFEGIEDSKIEGERYVVKGVVNEGRRTFILEDALAAGDVTQEIVDRHTHVTGGYWYPKVEKRGKDA